MAKLKSFPLRNDDDHVLPRGLSLCVPAAFRYRESGRSTEHDRTWPLSARSLSMQTSIVTPLDGRVDELQRGPVTTAMFVLAGRHGLDAEHIWGVIGAPLGVSRQG